MPQASDEMQHPGGQVALTCAVRTSMLLLMTCQHNGIDGGTLRHKW